jgi:hypothetical protein
VKAESQVALELGPSWLAADGRVPWGSAFTLEARRGLTDAWALTLRGHLSRHGVDADATSHLPGGGVKSYAAMAGVTYALDKLRVVPYVEILLGYLAVTGDVVAKRHQIGAQAVAGGEYLIDRRLTVGLSAAYIYAPVDLVSNAMSLGSNPYFFSLSARVGWTF